MRILKQRPELAKIYIMYVAQTYSLKHYSQRSRIRSDLPTESPPISASLPTPRASSHSSTRAPSLRVSTSDSPSLCSRRFRKVFLSARRSNSPSSYQVFVELLSRGQL